MKQLKGVFIILLFTISLAMTANSQNRRSNTKKYQSSQTELDSENIFSLPSGLKNRGHWKIQSKSGQTIELRFKSNRSTGIVWILNSPNNIDNTIITPLQVDENGISSNYLQQNTISQGVELVGVPGQDIFKFQLNKAGNVELTFRQKRPSQKKIYKEITVELTIE
jgi:predicted secreted protein